MSKWLLLLFVSYSVASAPLSSLKKQGEGDMSYLFWTLYKAEYFTGEALKNDGELTKALRITYKKSLSKQTLIEATQDQWKKLGYKDEQVTNWLAALSVIWPDVEQGDQLTLLVAVTGKSEFYLLDNQLGTDNLLGTISDKDFGKAFLSIWLSKNTSEPKLRLQLLGITQ